MQPLLRVTPSYGEPISAAVGDNASEPDRIARFKPQTGLGTQSPSGSMRRRKCAGGPVLQATVTAPRELRRGRGEGHRSGQ